MGAIKAFSLWFPLSRLATLNGLYLGIGGLGGLSATAPVEALLGPFGWRALFYGLALALGRRRRADLLRRAGEAAARRTGRRCAQQIAGFGRSSLRLAFWRIALPLVVCHAGYQALQGLWLAPWLYDVAGPAARRGGRLPAGHRASPIPSARCSSGCRSDRLARAGRLAHDGVQAGARRVAGACSRCSRPACTTGLGAILGGVRLHRDLGLARLRAVHAAVPAGR